MHWSRKYTHRYFEYIYNSSLGKYRFSSFARSHSLSYACVICIWLKNSTNEIEFSSLGILHHISITFDIENVIFGHFGCFVYKCGHFMHCAKLNQAIEHQMLIICIHIQQMTEWLNPYIYGICMNLYSVSVCMCTVLAFIYSLTNHFQCWTKTISKCFPFSANNLI